MKKRSISLLLNILIIILEIIGFAVSYNNMHRIGIEYFTEESNLLALICSIIFVIYLIKNKTIPKWLNEFKYITNINLAITFLVVLFILIPMDNFSYKKYLLDGTMKYHHLICPLLSICSFIFFDRLKKYNMKDLFIGLIVTFIYAIVMIILNILGTIIGPYPFLMVKNQSVLMSTIWALTILSFSFLIALLLMKLHSKYNN